MNLSRPAPRRSRTRSVLGALGKAPDFALGLVHTASRVVGRVLFGG